MKSQVRCCAAAMLASAALLALGDNPARAGRGTGGVPPPYLTSGGRSSASYPSASSFGSSGFVVPSAPLVASPAPAAVSPAPPAVVEPRFYTFLLSPATEALAGAPLVDPYQVAEVEKKTPAAPTGAAAIEMRVPANAEVWFDGVRSKQTGEVRTFRSPPLEAGSSYLYAIRVRWRNAAGQVIDRTQQIRVQPGRVTVAGYIE